MMGSMMSKGVPFILARAAVVDFGIQWTLWAVSSFLGTEKFYDLTGSATFVLLSLLTLRWGKRLYDRQVLQTSAVCAWALRLGTFLFLRILRSGHDSRFKKVINDPVMFLKYWTIQGVWIWITLLPTMILNTKQRDKPLTTRDYIGWSIWLVGFLLECIADHQKSNFRSIAENRGKWIDTGLWSISRHPNYLGEILMWIGMFLPASTVMSNTELFSVISPLFVTFLLTKVSGIPILERQGQKRWGHIAEYRQYQARTAKLIPYVW